MRAVLCGNLPLRKEEKLKKVYVSTMKHVNTDELERKLKEKKAELIRLLGKEGHIRSEQR